MSQRHVTDDDEAVFDVFPYSRRFRCSTLKVSDLSEEDFLSSLAATPTALLRLRHFLLFASRGSNTGVTEAFFTAVLNRSRVQFELLGNLLWVRSSGPAGKEALLRAAGEHGLTAHVAVRRNASVWETEDDGRNMLLV